ncbi:uncharacterized protein LOC132200456 [Neocloeon triangulifer]|uniref:uncharacterized protein LOC132200456 n=1 Tax=Neocloeon triangulifer TaxID=2078957 RepID=UPI00286F3E9C|nr:uncharacterized protein LOC132200456 [Neocloeon triangulifer]
MRLLAFIVPIILISLALDVEDAEAAVYRRRAKARSIILKCCGTKSCSKQEDNNTAVKGRNNATAITTKKDGVGNAAVANTVTTNSGPANTANADASGGGETPPPADETPPEGDPPTDAINQNLGTTPSGPEVSVSSSAATATQEPSTTGQKMDSSTSNTTTFTNSSTLDSTSNAISATSSTLSTSTTTTPTTTTTTLATTTTTQPPSVEELILGKCETFDKDVTQFTSDNSLKDPEKYGSWVESCGYQFVFGKTYVTWRENMIKCNEIGMEPLTVEDATKLECFSKMGYNWKYASNFWTSGIRSSQNTFSWCKKPTNVSFGMQIPWAAGQPDNANNSENCVHMSFLRENNPIKLSDRTCTDMFIFGCQGPTTPVPSTCASPVCSNVPCVKNPSLFSSTDILKTPMTYGTWFNHNGRTYMFSLSNVTNTFSGAMKACCDIGMSLLSLEYDYKYKSLMEAMKVNASSKSDFFWTSGSDQGCEGKFGFCTTQRTLRKDAVWAQGQPDNANGNDNAIAITVNSSHLLFYDANENSQYRYICEGRDTRKAKSGGDGVRLECAAAYNVTQEEQNTLFTKPNFDVRIRCFLKCVGENAGVMVNGKFVYNDAVPVMENMMAGNVTEYTNNFAIVDACKNSLMGMSECDLAAMMIKCTNDKAPQIVRGIIAGMEKTILLEKPPMAQPDAFCYDPSACKLNSALKLEVDNCASNCSLSAGDGLIRSACGKKYLYYKTSITWDQAFITCCEYGMKLASIDSQDELACLSRGLDASFDSVAMWVAASKFNSTVTRWCTSNVPFSLEGVSTFAENGNAYTFIMSQRNFNAETPTNTRPAFCVNM